MESSTALGSDGQGPHGFSFVFSGFFSDLFDVVVFYELGTSMFGLLGASVKLVRVRASAYPC